MRKTDTLTLAGALDILARDIESPDDVPALCLREAAERLRELAQARHRLTEAEDILADLASGYWQGVLSPYKSLLEESPRRMSDRILDYWANVEKTGSDFQHDPPAEPPHSGEKLPKEPPVSTNP